MWKQRLLRSLRRGPFHPPAQRPRYVRPSWPQRRQQTQWQWHSQRHNSTKPSPPHRAPCPAAKQQQSRLDRILSRLPAPLQRHTSGLRRAPLSYAVAFLFLHELTAAVPLLGLFGLFHYTASAPIGYIMDHYGSYVRDGTARFEAYFRRKGWFGFESDKGGGDGVAGQGPVEPVMKTDDDVLREWQGPDEKYRIVVEVALAYTIVKVLMPVRVMVSVWATPWCAGLIVRARKVLHWASRRG